MRGPSAKDLIALNYCTPYSYSGTFVSGTGYGHTVPNSAAHGTARPKQPLDANSLLPTAGCIHLRLNLSWTAFLFSSTKKTTNTLFYRRNLDWELMGMSLFQIFAHPSRQGCPINSLDNNAAVVI
jgi:hypothetical protein